ncbi:hypothetical protein DFJ74DRAFT_335499, partial [Hyaloraphidium curvatum]
PDQCIIPRALPVHLAALGGNSRVPETTDQSRHLATLRSPMSTSSMAHLRASDSMNSPPSPSRPPEQAPDEARPPRPRLARCFGPSLDGQGHQELAGWRGLARRRCRARRARGCRARRCPAPVPRPVQGHLPVPAHGQLVGRLAGPGQHLRRVFVPHDPAPLLLPPQALPRARPAHHRLGRAAVEQVAAARPQEGAAHGAREPPRAQHEQVRPQRPRDLVDRRPRLVRPRELDGHPRPLPLAVPQRGQQPLEARHEPLLHGPLQVPQRLARGDVVQRQQRLAQHAEARQVVGPRAGRRRAHDVLKHKLERVDRRRRRVDPHEDVPLGAVAAGALVVVVGARPREGGRRAGGGRARRRRRAARHGEGGRRGLDDELFEVHPEAAEAGNEVVLP